MKIDKTKLMRKSLFFKAQEVDEKNYIIRGVFSTGGEDRHGEIIDQNGWKLNDYMENPVILFAHDQWTPAIGKAIELAPDGNGSLAGAIQFAVEEFELAKTIFNLYKGGFMRAFSVGFMNNKYEVDEENEVIILKENTLYEISCVNVPANAMALANSKGIDVTPIKKALKESIQKARKEKVEKKIENNEVDLSDKTIEKISDNLCKQLQKIISADNAGQKTKVETPAGKGGAKSRYSNRKINSAIRQLLDEKRSKVKSIKQKLQI